MRVVAGIGADLVARTQKWHGGFRRARKDLKGLKGEVRDSIGTFAKWTAGVLAAVQSIRSMASAFNETRHSIDALAKASDRLNVSTEALAGFNLAAKLAGASTEDVTRALTYMSRTIGEAATGAGEYEKMLNRVGVTSKYLLALKPEDQFRAIADGINRLQTSAERTSAAMDIFGRSGSRMMNLIAGGSEAIDRAQRIAQQAGTAIGRAAAANVERMNDGLTIAGEHWRGIKTEIVTGVATALDDLVTATNKWVEASRDAHGQVSTFWKALGATDKLNITPYATDAAEAIAKETEVYDDAKERAREHAEFIASMRSDNERTRVELNTIMESDAVKHAQKLLEVDKTLYEEKAALRLKEHDEWQRMIEQEQRQHAMNRRQSFAFLSSMTSQLAGQSKEWFRINQAVSLANAVVNTNEAMTKALSFGGPAGFAMAGLIGAAGLANIAAIASASYEGGGTVSGVDTPPADNGSADTAQTVQSVSITLQGDSYNRDSVLALIGQINEAVGDGAQLRAT